MDDQPRVLATVRSYTELHEALRARADALQVTREAIDHVTGWPSGYAGKVLAPVPIKTLNAASMGPLLTVLGLAIVVVEDQAAIDAYVRRLSRWRRDASVVMRSAQNRKKRQHPHKGDSLWAKEMNAWRRLKTSPKQRSKSASFAAKMRWSKPRVTEIKAPAKRGT